MTAPSRSPSELRSRDWCIAHYVDRKTSMQQIAVMLGCTASAVTYWMGRHQIPIRSAQEARDARLVGRKRVCTTVYIDHDQDADLKRLASSTGVAAAEHVRRAIGTYLAIVPAEDLIGAPARDGGV